MEGQVGDCRPAGVARASVRAATHCFTRTPDPVGLPSVAESSRNRPCPLNTVVRPPASSPSPALTVPPDGRVFKSPSFPSLTPSVVAHLLHILSFLRIPSSTYLPLKHVRTIATRQVVLWHAPWAAASREAEAGLGALASRHPQVVFVRLDVTASQVRMRGRGSGCGCACGLMGGIVYHTPQNHSRPQEKLMSMS